jgi:hypothetical protein
MYFYDMGDFQIVASPEIPVRREGRRRRRQGDDPALARHASRGSTPELDAAPRPARATRRSAPST